MNNRESGQALQNALSDATHLWRQALDRRLRPLGLSQATWKTLFNLDRFGEGMTQRALAERMGIEGPTLVRLLDNLERGGLVERRPAPGDRRAKSLHLTARARDLLVTLHRVADEVRDEMLADLREDELRRAVAVLRRVAGNAERSRDALRRSA